ncbi:NADP-dependent oxidoreductase [Parvibaculum sp.]|uniref:NADP-dependent oxidoreductase n=1 Tax=Parvibaculum sp. TaxID=2024848 RepID=UPI001DFAB514|nr:NADP-dependent oxidoreductase [Parvibaculum sp.]MBX3490928.1 NADP-dependent oxidoreductase [Parvibaculum sp.]MCW5728754.1 NADP-dependent oxidoreductase [Parvibaculum sp.]
MPTKAKRWVLASRPAGKPKPENFRLEDVTLPDPGEHELLIRTEHHSVDPGMRGRLSGDSYTAALPVGETIDSAMVGVVEASNNEKFAVGDRVTGGFGWVSHAISNGRGIQKLDPAIYHGKLRPTAAIGVLGIPGLTSYFGLLDLGQPKEGDTVLISSAAGPVGATAGQIAKMKGCRVVGIAGSKEKCDYVKGLGFDECFSYRGADLRAAIAAACPDGVDIYFDNVGGEMLDAAILNMKEHGRIVVSGQVSEYNRTENELRGIRNVTRFITHRLRMEGLVVFDYFKQFREAQGEMAGWIHDGKLVYTEDVSDGIEGSAAAFIGLFEGENLGRRLIKVS